MNDVPWLRRPIVEFTPWNSGFISRPVAFAINKVSLKKFSSITSFIPVSIIPPMLHTYLPRQYHSTKAIFPSSLIFPVSTNPQCSIFISPVSITPPMFHTYLPCQYHSTNVPYSSPPSVSFPQCSIFISPVSITPPMLHTYLPCQYNSTNVPYSSPLSV